MQSIDKLEKVAVRGGDKKLKPEYVSTWPVSTLGIELKYLYCWVFLLIPHVIQSTTTIFICILKLLLLGVEKILEWLAMLSV